MKIFRRLTRRRSKLDRAIDRAEVCIKENPHIRYTDLFKMIMKRALCSEPIAKEAIACVRSTGNALTSGRYKDGYTWTDNPTPKENKVESEIKRVKRQASECKAPVVNRLVPWLG